MLIDTLQRYHELFRQGSEAKKYMEVVALQEKLNAELRAQPPSIQEVLCLFNDILKNPQMDVAASVFVSAWYHLSDEYVPVLCEVVLDERCNNWHEQAVELLAELSDPKSIPALTRALGYRWDFDEWHNIPRKALNSLGEIGSSEAVVAIRNASNAEEQSIRDEAVELLKQLEM